MLSKMCTYRKKLPSPNSDTTKGIVHTTLPNQLANVTMFGAIAAARKAGYGDKEQADDAAVEAMRNQFNSMPVKATIVIGEGERDEAPMLYIGEQLGSGGPAIDIAVDPLENTNATATLGPRAISVLAASESGGLFHAPDMYMEKLIVGPEAAPYVDLDFTVKKNIAGIAKGLERDIEDLVIVVLDRDRHEDLVADIRATGARVKLIPDGDLLPGIAAAMRGTGIHAVMGIGAAPEGVITAAALRCIKGKMQARFWPKNEEEKKRLKKMGGSLNKVYTHEELAPGKTIIFSATGVTNGDILHGVRFFGHGARTQTLLMDNQSHQIRFIDTTHVFDKLKIEYHL